MTELLYQADAYLQSCSAIVESVDDAGLVVLDRTVGYPQGGGQPGDKGTLKSKDGCVLQVNNIRYDADRKVVHILEGYENELKPGDEVSVSIDWSRRHKLMRVHTAMHLLSVVLPYPVTGGQVGEGEGRLDFDLPDANLADKEQISEQLNRLIQADHPVSTRWITDEELDANPGLVKTMMVQPPRGAGRVRLISIGDIDLQPCGGTHVKSTAEIGKVYVVKTEKKGARNRRIKIALAS